MQIYSWIQRPSWERDQQDAAPALQSFCGKILWMSPSSHAPDPELASPPFGEVTLLFCQYILIGQKQKTVIEMNTALTNY